MTEPVAPSSSNNTAKDGVPSNNTSSSSPQTLKEAVQDVSLERMRNIGKVPCARDSLLYGIGGGIAVGAGRFITSRKALTASNWAVGAFALISIGCWEWCHFQRFRHAQKVGLVVEKLNQLEERRRREGTAITADSTDKVE